MAEGEGKPTGPDTGRIDWIQERVVASLGCKADRFKKLMTSEEGSRAIVDFMNVAEVCASSPRYASKG